jgi:hypothetical protein
MIQHHSLGIFVVLILLSSSLWNEPALAQSESEQDSLLGMNLSAAENTDFFTWFQLQEIGRQEAAEKQTVAILFKPEGEAVRELVTVKVSVSAQEEITAIELILARSFVNDKGPQSMLARDISKSLLLATISEIDQPALKDLVNQISSDTGYYSSGTDVTVIRSSAAPKPVITDILDTPTPGYMTYLGKQPSYTQKLSNGTLDMENIKEGEVDVLQIGVYLDVAGLVAPKDEPTIAPSENPWVDPRIGVLAFVKKFWNHHTSNDPGDWASDFSPQAAYCYSDSGLADRKFIRYDRAKLLDRYPVRNYKFFGPDIQMSGSDNSAQVTYSFTYSYAGTKSTAGSCRVSLTLHYTSGSWLISEYDEKVDRQ